MGGVGVCGLSEYECEGGGGHEMSGTGRDRSRNMECLTRNVG